MSKPIIVIIGAGVYGTAMAVALSKNGNKVILWGHKVKHIRVLKMNRINNVDLPSVLFPPSLCLEESLSEALYFCQDIMIAVPSHAFRVVLMQLKLSVQNNIRIIIASKGLDVETGRLLQDIVYDILGYDVPFAVMSGPVFAKELAIGLPAAITLASTNVKFVNDIRNILCSIDNLRVYIDTDIVGVQIAGAIKNIIAIGAGISDGIGFGSNARAALITRGLLEMSRFGVAMGAIAETFTGLAGLGDLVLTCTDDQSRNRRFGLLLGQGVSVDRAQRYVGQIIEGIYSTQAIYMLSIKYGVVMPITKQIYKVLYQNKNVRKAAYDLIKRTNTSDSNMV